MCSKNKNSSSQKGLQMTRLVRTKNSFSCKKDKKSFYFYFIEQVSQPSKNSFWLLLVGKLQAVVLYFKTDTSASCYSIAAAAIAEVTELNVCSWLNYITFNIYVTYLPIKHWSNRTQFQIWCIFYGNSDILLCSERLLSSYLQSSKVKFQSLFLNFSFPIKISLTHDMRSALLTRQRIENHN